MVWRKKRVVKEETKVSQWKRERGGEGYGVRSKERVQKEKDDG